jgi:hypothetical protein
MCVKLKLLPEIKQGKSLSGSGAQLLVEAHVDRVAVLEPDLVRRLRGAYVAAAGSRNRTALGRASACRSTGLFGVLPNLPKPKVRHVPHLWRA